MIYYGGMRQCDFKYLVAYVAPLLTFAGVYVKGAYSFSGWVFGFVVIPLLDVFAESSENASLEEEERRNKSRLFDVFLFLNLPLLWLLLGYYLYTLHHGSLSLTELTGMTLSVGLMVGTQGINVAHELGHRSEKWAQRAAQALLLPALYMHFFIEHNRGHHRHVGTKEDPATARLNETVYSFWVRSIFGSYLHAWTLEAQRLTKIGKSSLHPSNQMILFQFFQVAYLGAVFFFGGFRLLAFALAIAVVGILMLETVNYIEHYGLFRKPLVDGRIEPVQPHHSWNSNHQAGRLILYELSRHSDHHFKASRKYQTLRHFNESPQLPVGYPASILMSLVPPLWFIVMNRRVQHWAQTYTERDTMPSSNTTARDSTPLS